MSKEELKQIQEEVKKAKTIDNSNIGDDESQFYTDETEEPDFFSFRIISEVTGIKKNDDDNTKVQVQTKKVDKVTNDLIEETFTLNNEDGFTDDILKTFYKKNIKVENASEYQEIIRNTQTKAVENRIKRYGRNFNDLSIITTELDEPFSINKYCKVELVSVRSVLKKGKATGDVKLISLIQDGFNQRSFTCILKGVDGVKWNATKFDKMIGKEVYISNIYSIDNNRERKIVHYTERAPRIELK